MKIKTFILFVLFIVCTSIQVDAQTGKDNLNKYWLYRDRLRKYFVVEDPNDGFGTNIPFWWTNNCDPNSGITLTTGDGNDDLQYYIGMLATEYALLKRYGIDLTQTRNELLYALKAVERLDKYAESNWRADHSTSSDDLNGFFIRDDIKSDFIDTWKSKYPALVNFNKVNTNFVNSGNARPVEESKDMIWNFLPNLLLVTLLVDDPEINLKAKDITYRMINYMHYVYTFDVTTWCLKCWPPGWRTSTASQDLWQIMNPITGEMVHPGGSDEESLFSGFSYGFAQAGEAITGSNLDFGYSHDQGREDYFYTQLEFPGIWPSRYPHLALATVGGNSTIFGNLLNDGPYTTVMGALISNLSTPYDKSMYEHLFLIRSLLVQNQINIGNDSNIADIDYFTDPTQYVNPIKNIYDRLLNEAPICGPQNSGATKIRVDDWAMDNRLTNSRQLYVSDYTGAPLDVNNCEYFGVFNGIDYMLLHNLYWLNYIPFGNYSISEADADYYFNIAKNTTDISIKQIYTNLANQLLLNDQKGTQIISTRTIPIASQIEYTASEDIELMPGFEADAGSCFDATINENWEYKKNDPTNLIESCGCYNSTPFNIGKTKSYEETDISNSIVDLITAQNKDKIKLDSLSKINSNNFSVNISPNPNNGIFTIGINGSFAKLIVKIYSLIGEEIYSVTLQNTNPIQITIPNSGVYFVTIDNGVELYRKKVICQ